MSKTIWKYDVLVEDDFVLKMPIGAQVLTVQTQVRMVYGKGAMSHVLESAKEVPTLWAIVDPSPGVPEEERKFRLVGTGNPMPDHLLSYIGSFQFHQGELIFHLFEHIVRDNRAHARGE